MLIRTPAAKDLLTCLQHDAEFAGGDRGVPHTPHARGPRGQAQLAARGEVPVTMSCVVFVNLVMHVVLSGHLIGDLPVDLLSFAWQAFTAQPA